MNDSATCSCGGNCGCSSTPDFSKCNCGAGPYGIHSSWCGVIPKMPKWPEDYRGFGSNVAPKKRR